MDRVAGQSRDRFRVGVVADTVWNNESTDETSHVFLKLRAGERGNASPCLSRHFKEGRADAERCMNSFLLVSATLSCL
jgi:hypothetical protein